MKEIEKLQSKINTAKAQLEQLLSSDHFTQKDVELLAPRYALNIQALQRELSERKLSENDTLRVKDIEIKEAVQL